MTTQSYYTHEYAADDQRFEDVTEAQQYRDRYERYTGQRGKIQIVTVTDVNEEIGRPDLEDAGESVRAILPNTEWRIEDGVWVIDTFIFAD